MEIKVNIPKNDYKEPTEVRQDVVQCICEHSVKKIKENGVWWFHVFESGLPFNYLWLGRYENGSLRMLTCAKEPNDRESRNYLKDCVKVHTVEMQAVFDAILDAGYYITGSYNCTSEVHEYIFTDRFDRFDHHTKKFAVCID